MAESNLRVRIFIAVVALSAFGAPGAKPAICQSKSDDVERAFADAARLHESGDIEGAIRSYQAILVSHPNRVDVRSNLGAA